VTPPWPSVRDLVTVLFSNPRAEPDKSRPRSFFFCAHLSVDVVVAVLEISKSVLESAIAHISHHFASG